MICYSSVDTRVEERHFTQRGKLLTDNLLPFANKKVSVLTICHKEIHPELCPVHLKPPPAGTQGARFTVTGGANSSSAVVKTILERSMINTHSQQSRHLQQHSQELVC